MTNFMMELKKIADKNGFKLSQNAEKVARYREVADIPLSICCCHKNDKERFCISQKCMDDIKNNGICACNVFLLDVS